MSACAICKNPAEDGSAFCAVHRAKVSGPAVEARVARSTAKLPNAALVCPHCQTVGHVRAEVVKQKRGISGGKATGAVLTGGVSLFATGLSRKQKVTRMTCGNCQTTWVV